MSGTCYIYITDKAETEKYKTAPKIRMEHRLNSLLVNEISFERNGLYLNNIQYNADGISGYSKLHSNDSIFRFSRIKPPFVLRKKENNDSLELIKDNRSYFMNVSFEQEWAKQ